MQLRYAESRVAEPRNSESGESCTRQTHRCDQSSGLRSAVRLACRAGPVTFRSLPHGRFGFVENLKA